MPENVGYNNEELDIDSKPDRRSIIKDYWDQANEGLWEENERFAENFRFYVGGDGQWEQSDLAILDEQGRPHLSINKCMPSVNIISGYQRKFRDALTVFPRRGGTVNTAQILTELGRHAMDSSRPSGDYCLSEAFLMAVIGGKWWAGWREDMVYDPINGDIAPESVPYTDVLEDPLFTGYDVDDNNPYNYCRFLFRTWWMEPKQIKVLWPDKKKEIDGFSTSSDSDEDYYGGSNSFVNRSVCNSIYGDYSGLRTLRTERAEIKRYMVRRCFYKVWKTKHILLNKQSGQRFDIDSNLGRAKKLVDASNGTFELFSHSAPELYQTTYLGSTELDHEVDPNNGIINYPLTRISPYWTDGHAMGMIDNLKEPQMEMNKARSQILSHLNQSVNSGWLMPYGSVDDGADMEEYENSSRPGFIGKYKPEKGKPEKQFPSPPSPGHLAASELASKDFEEITNVNSGLTGNTDQKESGTALETRREQGLTTNQVMFDNFNIAEVALYDNLIERIRTPNKNGTMLYSPEEVEQIVQEHNLESDEDIIENMSQGRYGLKVGRSPTTPTARTKAFDEILALFERVPSAAAEIDIIEVLDASNISKKDKLIQSISNRRQQVIQQAVQDRRQELQAG